MVATVAHVLHANAIRSLVDGKTFGRGKKYFDDARVEGIERDGVGIAGSVRGTENYAVKIWVKGSGLAYTCSCPMGEEGHFCKHCVAVALAWIDAAAQQASSEPAASTSAVDSRVIQAPATIPETGRALFLSGSIDMGSATDWQARFVDELGDVDDLVILNPRRDDWDASWDQSIDDARFREQVEWELDAMDRASIIAVYFDPEGKAPVTLMELGLQARSGKLVVFCPEGYWRKGNVDVLCRRYGVHQVHSFDELVAAVRARIGAS